MGRARVALTWVPEVFAHASHEPRVKSLWHPEVGSRSLHLDFAVYEKR